MASGTISLSGGGALYGQIVWWSETDINSNCSYVTAALQFGKSNSYTGTTGTFTGYLNVDGHEDSDSYYGFVESYWHDMFSLRTTVYHNDDGSARCYIGGEVKGPNGTSLAGKVASGGETVTLDTIPREATLTGASNFNDEQNPVINYDNPGGNSVTSLQACISLTGDSADIPYRNISKTGSSYTFNLTTTERNTLRNATSTANSRSVKFILKAVIGSKTLTSTLSRTLTIVNANPTLNPSVTDTNALAASLTGDANKLVRYVSAVNVSSGAAAIKGATLKSISIVNGNNSLASTSGTFDEVQSGDFVFTAIDSRSNTTTKTITKSIVNYVKLTCNIGNNTPDAAGNFRFNVSGNYFKDTFGAVTNTLLVEYRYKVAGGAFSSWKTLSPAYGSNTYSAYVDFTGLDYQTVYTFQARATDKVKTVSTQEQPIQSTPIFDWGQDDFKVNVPMSAVRGMDVQGELTVNGKPINPYPVGAIYMSVNSTSPASIFGGSWTQLQNRFLLGAGSSYSNGATGGSATHTH